MRGWSAHVPGPVVGRWLRLEPAHGLVQIGHWVSGQSQSSVKVSGDCPDACCPQGLTLYGVQLLLCTYNIGLQGLGTLASLECERVSRSFSRPCLFSS